MPARLARPTLCILVIIAAAVSIVTGCTNDDAVEPTTPAGRSPAEATAFEWPEGPHPTVTLHVADYGDIGVELYRELAPITVDNFIKLSREGFFDGTTFHRVVADFMIQGGDPNSRDDNPNNDGYGDPGYTIPDEHNAAPHLRGVLSMANKGQPDTGGSQFFIIHQDSLHLDGLHTVFGRVVTGLEVVDRIASVEVDENGRWGKRHRPLEHIVLSGTTVHEAGQTARTTSASPAPPRG